MYNKRTWLNKSNSPSLGNVVAFDGEVEYSNGTERTTFLAVSDCRNTIKLIKNTETTEDFIDKMKSLKQEIELFINHLEQTIL
jgi:aspartyl/asparaginyl-tRNA synthetase